MQQRPQSTQRPQQGHDTRGFNTRRQERFDGRQRYFVPKQPIPRQPTKYTGPEVKLFCGHWVPEPVFTKGSQNHDLRCPKCGMSWRGSMVINNRKSDAKKELWEAIRRENAKSKDRPRK